MLHQRPVLASALALHMARQGCFPFCWPGQTEIKGEATQEKFCTPPHHPMLQLRFAVDLFNHTTWLGGDTK